MNLAGQYLADYSNQNREPEIRVEQRGECEPEERLQRLIHLVRSPPRENRAKCAGQDAEIEP